MVHQWVDTTVGDTFWLQAGMAPVASAGTPVQIADTAPKTDRWNFAAVEIVSARPPVGVPNVVNQTETTAAAAIVAAGLTLGPVTHVTSATVPAGTIISQSPVAGTQVVPGTPVSLVASSGPPLVTVPDVSNLTQAAASAAITTAGLAVGTVTSASSPTVPAGAVISQSPLAGIQIAVGSAVALVVSSGLPLVAVPDVSTLTQAAATAAITAANLIVGNVTTSSSMTVPAGAVISQNPAAGTQIVVGSAVALVVSSGLPLVAVPNVINATQAMATTAITSVGLTVAAITTAPSLTVPAGAVISQNPVAGTQITLGSAVALVVSSGLPLVAVPNVVNATQAVATTAIGSVGLTVGTITTASSATVPAGSVISQNPAAGTQVVVGSPVALVVSSGPAPAIAIDQMVWADGRGTQSVVFSTSLPGEIIVAFVASDGASTGGQTTTVSGAGLSWTLVQRANTQAGTAEIWKATAPAVLSSATVTSTQSQSNRDQSLTVVTFSGASGIGASAKQSSATGAASATVTTTRANAWVFGVGNDWDQATPRVVIAGQAMIHQWVDTGVGDTFWVQSSGAKISNAGTSVRLGVTSPTADRSNFAVVEIVP
jgi:beta-lactam-binding protein with PASTA domain